MRIGSFLPPHWLALVLALAVGALTALPQLVAEYRMGEQFLGIHPLVTDDDLYYQTRAREVVDGHPTLGSPYLAEHKGDLAPGFWMPDAILASVGHALTGDVQAGFVLWDFVLPAFLVLGAYAILYAYTKNVSLSLAIAAFINPGLLFFAFNRGPNPQLFVLFLAAFFGLMRTVAGKGLLWPVATAVCGGALFYVYPFYSTYFVALTGLTFVFSFALFRTNGAHMRLLLVLLGACVVAAPYLLGMWEASRIPEYHESLRRIGGLDTHLPSGSSMLAVTLPVLCFLLVCWHKRWIPRAPETLLLFSAVLAGPILVNQQVVTGLNYFFTIHYTPLVLFMSVIAAGVGAASFLRDRKRLAAFFAFLLITGSFPTALPTLAFIATPATSDIAAQRYRPVLDFLAVHAPLDSVVYTDRELSLYLPSYTHINVFFAPFVFLSYLSQTELDARYLASHYLDESFSRESIINSATDVFGPYYSGRSQHAETHNRLRALLGIPRKEVERYPESRIASLLRQGETVRAGTFEEAIAPYRVDYIVWDSRRHPRWRMDAVDGLTELFVYEGMRVYRYPAR